MGDGTRLRLLFLLGAGEANVTELCARTGLPQPTVSHHLGLLRMADLVRDERRGKQVFYTLVTPPPQPGAIRVSRNAVTITVTPTAEKGRR